MATVRNKPGLLVLNRVTVSEASFQAMADATMTEVRKMGGELAKKVRAVSPVGPRRRNRSKSSRAYGPLRSGKTKFTTRGRRVMNGETRSGKTKWKYRVERAVLVTPFYGYFIDKGWNAIGGKRAHIHSRFKSARQQLTTRTWIPGNSYVTDTIKNHVR